ncbi:MAG: hypothetical protein H6702_21890 [Myxococcales bacterium]|nr:hypothetical protein [Myxococcales bacterium]
MARKGLAALLGAALVVAIGCAETVNEGAVDARVTPEPSCRDLDRDGYGEGMTCRGPDCNDDDNRMNPGALEVCDGLDNDCNGAVDDALVGRDCALTRGVCAGSRQRCVEGTWTACGGEVSYGPEFEADETLCDRLDNDCDGFTDEGCPCEAGATQPCGDSEGECRQGTQTCEGAEWGPCQGAVSPAQETCDGRDQDCDGTIDEELDTLPPDCPLTEGVCAGATKRCTGAGGWSECGLAEYGPTWVADEGAAHCDELDNDCDGRVDEGCGCAPNGAERACGSDVGACLPGVQVCGEGTWGECRGGNPPRGEACNGLDDDCDGRADESLEAPACARNQGVCAGAVKACGGEAGWLPCDAAAYAAHDAAFVEAETEAHCDRVDNDCDGNVDEACQCADGAIQNCGTNEGACTQGRQICQGGRFAPCDGVGPIAELCNDIDDDCDGRLDEQVAAPPCPLQQGVCNGATARCEAGVFAACGAASYGPAWQANETFCDERDNDCDGRTDEGCDCVDNAVQRCGTEVGACSRGSQTCVGGAWGPCDGAVEPVAEACDGVDSDCDGETDEDLAAPACPLQQGVCAGAVRACQGERGFAAGCGAAEYGEAWVAQETDAHCDGRDNDCDGQTDEACECVVGGERPVCGSAVGACEPGLLRCEGGRFTACEGAVEPAQETCDGQDEDCDGATDENLERPACPLQVGVCAGAAQVCAGAQGFAACAAGAGYPATFVADEGGGQCDGLDNDCDGNTDEGCPAPAVIINEIYVNGPGRDGPNEFIELYGVPGETLNGLRLEAVNGSNGQVYATIPLAGLVPFNGYYLIVEAGTDASPGAQGTLRDIANLVVRGADLQNGPDSLRLMWNGQPIDAVAYGAFGPGDTAAGEGDPAAAPAEGQSLSRVPDGLDAGDNATDFQALAVPTPRGAPLPRIHLALRWAGADTDFDLHLLREGTWQSADDCHWNNRTPPWGPNGERGDPRLERDDAEGFGPEFTDYVAPRAGRYLVQVHYFSGSLEPMGPGDTAELAVFIDGVQAFRREQPMDGMAPYWAAVQIDVDAAGAIEVGEIGLLDVAPFDN